MAYGSISRGFKAGGFNPASPPGSEAYGEEHALHVEGGFKAAFASGRASLNAAVFYIDWDDLQLNVPTPFVPGQFYIANVGAAASRGVELELAARPHDAVQLFGSFGYTSATFVDVSGNTVPNTPDYTATIGTQLSHPITSTWSLFGRAEAVFYGDLLYDDTNSEGQEAYSLAHFRGGVRGRWIFGEVWVRNAFDTRYVPVAFPYQGFAPSGFIGEPGRPRTFGVNLGVTF
jgi:iron complex outermembrane receptor protein